MDGNLRVVKQEIDGVLEDLQVFVACTVESSVLFHCIVVHCRKSKQSCCKVFLAMIAGFLFAAWSVSHDASCSQKRENATGQGVLSGFERNP